MAMATTLMGRTERKERAFPLWIERLVLLAAIVLFWQTSTDVVQTVDHAVFGPFVGYLMYPLVLLAGVELLGRVLQSMLSS